MRKLHIAVKRQHSGLAPAKHGALVGSAAAYLPDQNCCKWSILNYMMVTIMHFDQTLEPTVCG